MLRLQCKMVKCKHNRNLHIYRVSQEECAGLREGVPYVKLYRYNPKHLCSKLNGYRDNGQRILKLWQLLHLLITKYILKLAGICGFCNVNICLNIKLTCEWHKAIKLKYNNTRTHVIVVLRVPSTIHDTWMSSTDVTWLTAHSDISLLHNCTKIQYLLYSWIAVIWYHTQGRTYIKLSADMYIAWTRQKTTLFCGHYLRNCSTLDIGVLGYIGIL